MNIVKATANDVQGLSALINAQKDDHISSEYLRKWYWENPSKSSSVMVFKEGEEILGMSSTNNFRFSINGSPALVAMPQKVLTDKSIRGQGVFSRLYFKNEEDNLQSENVDLFLTFTNAASTPIFLSKFGYLRARSPEMVLVPSVPFLRKRKNLQTRSVKNLNEEYLSKVGEILSSNGMLKSPAHHAWRYGETMDPSGKEYILVEILEQEQLIGIAVLKQQRRLKTSWNYVMDVITHDDRHIPVIINAVRRYARSKWAFGIVLMNNEKMHEVLSKIKSKVILKNKLNFLVKGKNEQETEALSQLEYNFFLGDLDFI